MKRDDMPGFGPARTPTEQGSTAVDHALISDRSHLVVTDSPLIDQRSIAALQPAPKGNRDALWFWADGGPTTTSRGQD